MKRIALIYLLGATVLASAANGVTLREYLDTKKIGGNQWEKMQVYILGAGDAFISANADLLYKKQPLLFCSPQKLGLRMENFVDMLDEFIEKTKIPFKENQPIAVVMAFSLKDAFPCK